MADKDELKEALKQALKEWLDEKLIQFGQFSFFSFLSILLAAAVYLFIKTEGWSK